MILMVFILGLCYFSIVAIPVSPCPNLFQYQRTVENRDKVLFSDQNNPLWKGLVTIRSTGIGKPIILKVLLAAPSVLPTKYAGKLELREDKNKAIEGEYKELHYDVYFPNRVPLPRLVRIYLNEQLICVGFRLTYNIVTKISLEHSLFPVRFNTSSMENSNTFPAVRSTLENSNYQCGQNQVSKNPLIVEGQISDRGSWPWLIPIFITTPLGLKFHCSGTLVTPQHVITAAHCLYSVHSETIPEEHVIAFVGKYNIRNWTEPFSQPYEVKKIHIHPDFNYENLENDLAVLQLAREVSGPTACLWTGISDLERVVIGWGVSEPGGMVSSLPRELSVTIVSNEECLRSQKSFLHFTSDKTFCAGNRDGTGPCNGDSGGGLYISVPATSGLRWHLRGVVSLSLKNPQTNECDLNNYIVFADTAKYKTWLQEKIRNL